MSIKNLLDFIAKPESGGDYNIVWGGIKAHDRPPRPLTEMTIGEVLDWQDSIDAKYMSEASGKYQIMEDTLRGLYREAGKTLNDMFDEQGQDDLAIALLKRRGLVRYLKGEIDATQFAQKLSMEWASLPATMHDRKRRPASGQSYYAGDGLNKSHVSIADFMAAVKAVKKDIPDQNIVLRYSSEGAKVEQWQKALNILGHNVGKVDGDFGSKTKAATRDLQKKLGMQATGFVTDILWDAVMKETPGLSQPIAKPAVSLDDSIKADTFEIIQQIHDLSGRALQGNK